MERAKPSADPAITPVNLRRLAAMATAAAGFFQHSACSEYPLIDGGAVNLDAFKRDMDMLATLLCFIEETAINPEGEAS